MKKRSLSQRRPARPIPSFPTSTLSWPPLTDNWAERRPPAPLWINCCAGCRASRRAMSVWTGLSRARRIARDFSKACAKPECRHDRLGGFDMRQLISSGSPFEAAGGYSRAVVDGEWVFVAGTTGFDYAAMTIADDPAEQTRQALRNIERALAEAGANLADIVRARYYAPDPADWPHIMPVLGEAFATIRPAAPAILCRPGQPAMEVEMEVTARRSSSPP